MTPPGQGWRVEVSPPEVVAGELLERWRGRGEGPHRLLLVGVLRIMYRRSAAKHRPLA